MEIRNATRTEIFLFTEWAKNEGWNPGVNDASAFWEADKRGFFIGIVNGKPAAIISCVKYDDDFAFMGFYIVKEEFRHKGYGIKIWEKAVKYAGDVNIGLDGVISQQGNYERSGFKLAYRNIRYEGVRSNIQEDFITEKYSGNMFEHICEFDKRHFLHERRYFLSKWLMNAHHVAVKRGQGHLSGFGVIRKCFEGYKIGQVFAEDFETAKEIIYGLLDTIPLNEKYFLDIPSINKDAFRIAEMLGMNPVFETVRMYNKSIPKLPVKNIFGVTTFELG